MNAMFNQVDFIHRLEAEGIARGAAEAIARGIDHRDHSLATKADLDDLRDNLRSEIASVRSDLKGEIASVRGDLKGEIASVRNELKGEIASVRGELDRFATKDELKLEIQAALSSQTVQVGAMLAAGLGSATAILGAIIAVH